MKLICQDCGGDFEREHSAGPIPKYCRPLCRLRAFKKRWEANEGMSRAAAEWRHRWTPEERAAESSRMSKVCTARTGMHAARRSRSESTAHLLPYIKKMTRRPSLVKGLRRMKDSRGRDYWVARIDIGSRGSGLYRRKTFSVTRLGESGAKLAAALQRLSWLIDLEVWRPDDGDPLAILGYTKIFDGNEEYENCKITGRDSPYTTRPDDADD